MTPSKTDGEARSDKRNDEGTVVETGPIGQGCGNHRIIMAAGWGAIVPMAGSETGHFIGLKFMGQNRIVKQGQVLALDGEGERFDQSGFRPLGGGKGSYGQVIGNQRIYVDRADTIGLGYNYTRLEMIKKRFEAISLEVIANLIEAIQTDLYGFDWAGFDRQIAFVSCAARK